MMVRSRKVLKAFAAARARAAVRSIAVTAATVEDQDVGDGGGHDSAAQQDRSHPEENASTQKTSHRRGSFNLVRSRGTLTVLHTPPILPLYHPHSCSFPTVVLVTVTLQCNVAI